MRKTLILAILLGGIAATPLAAQSGNINARVDKLEKEFRAVQRKVFPNGALVEAEIMPETTAGPPPGTPASAPLADLTQRVDALESQLAALTGQSEQNAYQIRQLQDQVKKLVADAEARAAAEAPAAPAVAPTLPAAGGRPPATAAAEQPAADGIARPSTGDEADDGYVYGFRLWQAKRYGEAQTELKTVVDKYPQYRRASFARNLLGRAYLDDNKPALASVAFYDNYQKLPKGERAPDSLYYLGVSLTQLKKPADACKVYEELQDVYGATLSASLKTMVADGRKKAKCTA